MSTKPEILISFETFLDELEYYRYSRLPIIALHLPRRQVVYIEHLRKKLLRDIGKYRPLIDELVDREEPQIFQKGEFHLKDLWLKGLDIQYDFVSIKALDFCIDIINVAIGKLEDDIDNEKRDNKGNKIIQSAKLYSAPPKAFISHGKKSEVLSKLEAFLFAIGIEPIIVSKQPNLDKTVDGKVEYYLDQADCVIILATGDDIFDGKPHARQNVIHEIGLAQITHPQKIVYLLEETTEFPSNIRTKVWESFNRDNLENVFTHISRELREFKILNATKP
ncbi:MAG: TIR domain-containing protein [Dehalococcoidales bacterium]